MFPALRKQQIISLLDKHGPLRSAQLADLLEVSYETIRRDLNELEADETVVRNHGGVQLPSRGSEPSYIDRSGQSVHEKAAIGRAAAELIKPGMTLIIDVGTTALAVARAIDEKFYGTVFTCSIPVAIELSNRPNVDVFVNAGKVRTGDLSISGSLTDAFYGDVFPDIAFLGSGGIDVRAGLTDFHLSEVTARRVILQNAERSYILADSTKFGRVAAHRVCSLSEVTGLLTNENPPEDLHRSFTDFGGQVIVAPSS